jgi:aldehyde dehydrogenase (NAD+)
LKPAIQTPDSTLFLKEVVDTMLPDGVFNVVLGDQETGRSLVEHDDVDMVSFTGSTAAGRTIAKTCGERLIPCVLELGFSIM